MPGIVGTMPLVVVFNLMGSGKMLKLFTLTGDPGEVASRIYEKIKAQSTSIFFYEKKGTKNMVAPL